MSLPKYLCGGVSAGEWPKMNGKKFALDLYESRCNNCVVEVMAPLYGPDGWLNKNADEIYSELKKFIAPIIKLDLYVTLHLINGNDEKMISRVGVGNVNHIVDKIASDFGVSKIILVPIAESHNEPGEGEVVNHCLQVWSSKGGQIMFNGTGRPHSIPGGYTCLDYHSQNPSDTGPQVGVTSLIDSDNGPMIRWLREGATNAYWNKDRVWDMATRCKAAGNGLNLYGYQMTSHEKEALKAMGHIYDVRKKVGWFQKLIAKIKLMFL